MSAEERREARRRRRQQQEDEEGSSEAAAANEISTVNGEDDLERRRRERREARLRQASEPQEEDRSSRRARRRQQDEEDAPAEETSSYRSRRRRGQEEEEETPAAEEAKPEEDTSSSQPAEEEDNSAAEAAAEAARRKREEEEEERRQAAEEERRRQQQEAAKKREEDERRKKEEEEERKRQMFPEDSQFKACDATGVQKQCLHLVEFHAKESEKGQQNCYQHEHAELDSQCSDRIPLLTDEDTSELYENEDNERFRNDDKTEGHLESWSNSNDLRNKPNSAHGCDDNCETSDHNACDITDQEDCLSPGTSLTALSNERNLDWFSDEQLSVSSSDSGEGLIEEYEMLLNEELDNSCEMKAGLGEDCVCSEIAIETPRGNDKDLNDVDDPGEGSCDCTEIGSSAFPEAEHTAHSDYGDFIYHVTGQFADPETGQFADRTTCQFGDHTTSQFGDHTTGQFGDHTTGQFADHTTGLIADHTTGGVADHTTGQVTDHTTGQFADHTTEQFANHATGQIADHTTGQFADHIYGHTAYSESGHCDYLGSGQLNESCYSVDRESTHSDTSSNKDYCISIFGNSTELLDNDNSNQEVCKEEETHTPEGSRSPVPRLMLPLDAESSTGSGEFFLKDGNDQSLSNFSEDLHFTPRFDSSVQSENLFDLNDINSWSDCNPGSLEETFQENHSESGVISGYETIDCEDTKSSSVEKCPVRLVGSKMLVDTSHRQQPEFDDCDVPRVADEDQEKDEFGDDVLFFIPGAMTCLSSDQIVEQASSDKEYSGSSCYDEETERYADGFGQSIKEGSLLKTENDLISSLDRIPSSSSEVERQGNEFPASSSDNDGSETKYFEESETPRHETGRGACTTFQSVLAEIINQDDKMNGHITYGLRSPKHSSPTKDFTQDVRTSNVSEIRKRFKSQTPLVFTKDTTKGQNTSVSVPKPPIKTKIKNDNKSQDAENKLKHLCSDFEHASGEEGKTVAHTNPAVTMAFGQVVSELQEQKSSVRRKVYSKMQEELCEVNPQEHFAEVKIMGKQQPVGHSKSGYESSLRENINHGVVGYCQGENRSKCAQTNIPYVVNKGFNLKKTVSPRSDIEPPNNSKRSAKFSCFKESLSNLLNKLKDKSSIYSPRSGESETHHTDCVNSLTKDKSEGHTSLADSSHAVQVGLKLNNIIESMQHHRTINSSESPRRRSFMGSLKEETNSPYHSSPHQSENTHSNRHSISDFTLLQSTNQLDPVARNTSYSPRRIKSVSSQDIGNHQNFANTMYKRRSLEDYSSKADHQADLNTGTHVSSNSFIHNKMSTLSESSAASKTVSEGALNNFAKSSSIVVPQIQKYLRITSFEMLAASFDQELLTCPQQSDLKLNLSSISEPNSRVNTPRTAAQGFRQSSNFLTPRSDRSLDSPRTPNSVPMAWGPDGPQKIEFKPSAVRDNNFDEEQRMEEERVEREREEAARRKEEEEKKKKGKRKGLGGLSPEKKKLLKKLIMQKAAEDLRNEAKKKAEEKERYINERVPVLNTSGMNQADLQGLCKNLHDKVCALEEDVFDWEIKIRKQEFEINELTLKVNDTKGKFIKPVLRKVNKTESKLAKLDKKESRDFRSNLKSTGQNKFALDEKEEAKTVDWRQSLKGKEGEEAPAES